MSSRPYVTDYAGAWRGHCKTRESAIIAAVKHMLTHCSNRCTIIGPEGDVARLRRHSDNRGVEIMAVKPLPVKHVKPKLKRVA